MIDKKEVKHIAKLARLELEEKEIRRLQKDLCLILDYVGKLKEIDSEISGLAPAKHLLEAENVMRKDEVRSDNKAKKLLDMASQTKNGYLKVKSILR